MPESGNDMSCAGSQAPAWEPSSESSSFLCFGKLSFQDGIPKLELGNQRISASVKRFERGKYPVRRSRNDTVAAVGLFTLNLSPFAFYLSLYPAPILKQFATHMRLGNIAAGRYAISQPDIAAYRRTATDSDAS